ncbi:MAG TPA: serine hydrolase, partial [bacterium]|nr:serine hydrolase [bacterium]
GEDGGLQRSSFALPEDVEFEFGGGGLYGTARDYLAFTRMILGQGSLKGTRVLRPETVALMGQNHLGPLRVAEMHAASAITRDSNFWPGMPCTWGLSFLINTARTPQGRSAGSLAWAGLANTYYWIDPVKHITGVFCTQILPFFDAQAIGLFREFETTVYRSL